MFKTSAKITLAAFALMITVIASQSAHAESNAPSAAEQQVQMAMLAEIFNNSPFVLPEDGNKLTIDDIEKQFDSVADDAAAENLVAASSEEGC